MENVLDELNEMVNVSNHVMVMSNVLNEMLINFRDYFVELEEDMSLPYHMDKMGNVFDEMLEVYHNFFNGLNEESDGDELPEGVDVDVDDEEYPEGVDELSECESESDEESDSDEESESDDDEESDDDDDYVCLPRNDDDDLPDCYYESDEEEEGKDDEGLDIPIRIKNNIYRYKDEEYIIADLVAFKKITDNIRHNEKLLKYPKEFQLKKADIKRYEKEIEHFMKRLDRLF
jgi:hypothetical protein